ncbi:unnamed protein product [Aphanomyces euteiches]
MTTLAPTASAWGISPSTLSTPQVNLRSIMDETLALRLEHDQLLELEGQLPPIIVPEDSVNEEMDADFAYALALQLEEHTLARESQPLQVDPEDELNDDMGDDEAVIPLPRLRPGRVKTSLKSKTKSAAPKRSQMQPPVVQYVEEEEEMDLTGLYELFFVPSEAFNEVIHEMPFQADA